MGLFSGKPRLEVFPAQSALDILPPGSPCFAPDATDPSLFHVNCVYLRGMMAPDGSGNIYHLVRRPDGSEVTLTDDQMRKVNGQFPLAPRPPLQPGPGGLAPQAQGYRPPEANPGLLNEARPPFNFEHLTGGLNLPNHETPTVPEDAVFSEANLSLGIIVNGTGSNANLASRTAVEAAQRSLAPGRLPPDANVNQTARAIQEAAENARISLEQAAQLTNIRDLDACIDICRVAPTTNGERVLLTAHVGIGRVYIWRQKTRQLEQVTTDHSSAQLLADIGQLTTDQAQVDKSRNQPYRTLSAAKAGTDLAPTVTSTPLEDGDVVLMMSNGVFNNLLPGPLQQVVNEAIQQTTASGYQGLAEFVCERAQNVSKSKAPHAHPDDISMIWIADKYPLYNRLLRRNYQPGERVTVLRNPRPGKPNQWLDSDWEIVTVDYTAGTINVRGSSTGETKLIQGQQGIEDFLTMNPR